jgi:hypothetical protein
LKSIYQYEKQDIVRWMTALIHDERMHVPDRELVAATIQIFGREHPLSFEDSWLVALKQSGTVVSVQTFDEVLQKRL